jgi:AAA domain
MSSENRSHHSIAKLIRKSRQTVVPWVIEGLWQQGGIAVVHSLEEEFKSTFSYQVAEAIASGSPLLRTWIVPLARRVGIFETEMDDLEMGKRFGKLYPDDDFPEGLIVSDSELLNAFRNKNTLESKVECLGRWIEDNEIQVLIWDTVNSILASTDPNSEIGISKFYDRLAMLPLKGTLIVRHDGKPSKDCAQRGSNQLVRGSNRIVEDASLVIHLKRQDKAQNKVRCEVGKLRNGRKPEPMELWFDVETFRLTRLHPIAAILEDGPHTRTELIAAAERRFGIRQRAIDGAINEIRSLLLDSMRGHNRVFELNRNALPEEGSTASQWWPSILPSAPPLEMQPCISTPSVPGAEMTDCGDGR